MGPRHGVDEWLRDDLPQLAAALAIRPGHEAVRTYVAQLLRHAFSVDYLALDHEVRMPEVHGRADMLFGATVFEFKSDLRQEIGDVEARLPDYLADRERHARQRFLGVATDGASFIAYELRGGALVEIGRHELRADRGEALVSWLRPVLSQERDLPPEPRAIERELGRESLTFRRAIGVLEGLWTGLGGEPEVALKRQLWGRLLSVVYGTEVGDDRLFLQHTYLTIVAKTIASGVLDLPLDNAAGVMSGQLLTDAGIHGAVESDFFDWVLRAPEGEALVSRVARQVGRYALREVRVDVLKALYESLIDPAQRHDLGEYYTPDWLAAKLVRRVVVAPLADRVLDPACGSGTFLFHAVRRLLEAAREAGWSDADAVAACAAQVRGIDVHPIAVIVARVTWLLALGPSVTARRGGLHVPVFLGDALQWNMRPLGPTFDMEVPVPDERPLRVPAGFAEDQAKYEPGLQALTEGLDNKAAPAAVRGALLRIGGVDAASADAMVVTFERLQALYKAGRDHIWPFVLRNLVRPLWLSRADQQADVLVGNPPWVAYRHLSAAMKINVREASQALGLWVGGVLATQQDISGLFWARGAARYLREGGRIGFVLPYAVLNRPAFAGLRAGAFRVAQVRIDEAWSFDETVQPLFPVPAAVLIGVRGATGALPPTVTRYSGNLPRRDATEDEADRALRTEVAPWPPMPTLAAASPYRAKFKQGATIVPRRFFFVERIEAGRLGPDPGAPRVRGRTSGQSKKPWSDVAPPEGPVEARFLRPVVLGESLAPFRLLTVPECVVPLEGATVLDAVGARDLGARHLSRWLADVEAKWAAHSHKRADGRPRITLRQQLDYMRKLTAQIPAPATRVVYTASGTNLTASVLTDQAAVIEHVAYWAPVRGVGEARYLCAVLNSETARMRIVAKQAKGQGGARHFDKLVWELRIPLYDRRDPLHRNLAAVAERAEKVAAKADVPAGIYFTGARKIIREALTAAGIAAEIDRLVTRLLDG